MGQLDQLKKLQIQKTTIKVPREPVAGEEQIELEAYAVALNDIESLMLMKGDVNDDAATMKKVKLFIAKSLRCEEKELDAISLPNMMDILEQLMDLNKMDESASASQIERLKKFKADKEALLNKQPVPNG